MATHTIAVAGKGGVGKTTICGMMVEYLVKRRKKPILVVDADPNSNLNEVLGIDKIDTIGDIREDITQGEMMSTNPVPPGMTKSDYAEMRFADAMTETDDFDMLVMGRSQGKGCYCFVNAILAQQVAKYANNYNFVLIDNEAGLEHVSRGLFPKINTLLLVSDSSRRGVQATARVAEIVAELKVDPDRMGLLINRAPGGELPSGIKEEIEKRGLSLLGVLPQDETIYEYDSDGKPSSKVPDDNAFKTKLFEIMDGLGLEGQGSVGI